MEYAVGKMRFEMFQEGLLFTPFTKSIYPVKLSRDKIACKYLVGKWHRPSLPLPTPPSPQAPSTRLEISLSFIEIRSLGI